MSKTKVEKPVEAKSSLGFYKGYEIKWLRSEPDHPDFYLVAEFDNLSRKEVSK